MDENRRPTGRTHLRGVPLPTGDYHLVVLVLLQNDQGECLITRRAPNKGYPNMWEFTGGSALAGDDSLHAALREAKE
ncbi:MAG: NUDIX domain-containing protein, partial [Clostridia bacterium]|nr:NUDIX domain-containing protein [Clostridia bacterium]